jgi:hypothetical protein
VAKCIQAGIKANLPHAKLVIQLHRPGRGRYIVRARCVVAVVVMNKEEVAV